MTREDLHEMNVYIMEYSSLGVLSAVYWKRIVCALEAAWCRIAEVEKQHLDLTVEVERLQKKIDSLGGTWL